MATPQLSPGVLIREVDLTVGRADNVLDNIGAIAGPFPLGPVNEPIDITTEQELIDTFGKPLSTDAQYEYWMSASSFLSYGGVLKVVRATGSTLVNANAGVGMANTTTLKIDNYDAKIPITLGRQRTLEPGQTASRFVLLTTRQTKSLVSRQPTLVMLVLSSDTVLPLPW